MEGLFLLLCLVWLALLFGAFACAIMFVARVLLKQPGRRRWGLALAGCLLALLAYHCLTDGLLNRLIAKIMD